MANLESASRITLSETKSIAVSRAGAKIAPVFISGNRGECGAGGSVNLESGAKQVLQETFGYQQFPPARKRLSTPYFPVAIAWSSAHWWRKIPLLSNPCLIAKRPTVVVSPLISLMKDQVDQLQATAWRRRALTRRKPASSNLKDDRLSHRANQPALYRAGTPELDNFLEHLAHWNPVLLAVDGRTVSPNGVTISARNTLPSVAASAFSDAAVYGADCHSR